MHPQVICSRHSLRSCGEPVPRRAHRREWETGGSSAQETATSPLRWSNVPEDSHYVRHGPLTRNVYRAGAGWVERTPLHEGETYERPANATCST